MKFARKILLKVENLFSRYRGPSPLKIILPPELKGMTLEDRLVSYDWERNFHLFEEATRTGTFKPLCLNTKGALLPETSMESHYPRILRPYEDPKIPCTRKPPRNKLSMLLSEDVGDDIGGTSDETNAVERGQLVRNKVSRSSFASSTSSVNCASWSTLAVTLVALLCATFR